MPPTDTLSRILVAAGLPEPVREYRFHSGRRWRFDYAYPEYLVALEVEGAVWTNGRHTRGRGYSEDARKYSEAAILGWCVIRVTTEQLPDAPGLLLRALGRRGWGGDA